MASRVVFSLVCVLFWVTGQTVPAQEPKEVRERATIEGHKKAVLVVAVAPKGELVASGDKGGTLKLWDAKSGKEHKLLAGHDDAVGSVVFTPDGKRLVSAGRSRVKVWDLENGKLVFALPDAAGALSVTADGKTLCVGNPSRRRDEIQLWDLMTGKRVKHNYDATDTGYNASNPDGPVQAYTPEYAISPLGRIVVCTMWDHRNKTDQIMWAIYSPIVIAHVTLPLKKAP